MRRLVPVLFSALVCWVGLSIPALACVGLDCDESPQVETGRGSLTASLVEQNAGGFWVASNAAPVEHPFTYQLSHPCVVDDRENGGCRATDFFECPVVPGRVIEDLIIERRRLVISDETGTGTTTEDGFPSGGSPVGTPVGPWISGTRACIDITALNPPPSPAEIFRYFQELPLPQLTTQQQPPGNGLVGLPVIFYTDSPTTQTFNVDIRGFAVEIVAGATAFTWHTGDGTDIPTTDPGAPYPDQTVTYDYSSGTYTAYLTTTWGATFSVNGGASVAVPGTTTTDGPPVTFSVLQARPVLTNPFD
ncbi:hypothetical protein E4P40_05815 [Blastococcus sp. CT_GayMR20]|uniref:hypothetical protein n=1 Tax=Blastococcus sp. CT_GayMR20 TaxID=2559609 RepID=UPI001073FD10|nr:hypothetical protein [Blastococcus sp. CT_GayMR20]TFV91543.1 hypothetical protein E4P40_05815 [Blastococcus sp. CT_GayMR20]